jgi:hypothetical protein
MKNCVYDIFEEVNETKFPGFKKTTWLECIQEPGEIIFVPSGWHHQVYNLVSLFSHPLSLYIQQQCYIE